MANYLEVLGHAFHVPAHVSRKHTSISERRIKWQNPHLETHLALAQLFIFLLSVIGHIIVIKFVHILVQYWGKLITDYASDGYSTVRQKAINEAPNPHKICVSRIIHSEVHQEIKDWGTHERQNLEIPVLNSKITNYPHWNSCGSKGS